MNDKDLKIEYTRGSGPGGQHKNKTETCVTVTHIPSGLQERCQDTRYKTQNLKIAKKRLRKQIELQQDLQVEAKKNEERKHRIRNSKVVRTYNYNRNEVIDHRTKVKSNLRKVLNGDLSDFY